MPYTSSKSSEDTFTSKDNSKIVGIYLKTDDTEADNKENIDPQYRKKNSACLSSKTKGGNDESSNNSNVLTNIPDLKKSGIRKIHSTIESCSDLFSDDDSIKSSNSDEEEPNRKDISLNENEHQEGKI